MAWIYITLCKQSKPVPSRRKTADVQKPMMSIWQHEPTLQEHFLKHPNHFSWSKIIQQKSLTTPPKKEEILTYFSFEKMETVLLSKIVILFPGGECKPKT